MADIALGRECPVCGTLVTVAGSFGDKVLSAPCSHCTLTGRNTMVSFDNPRYQPNKPGEPGPAIEMGKHDPELTERYTDATGESGTPPFKKTGKPDAS